MLHKSIIKKNTYGTGWGLFAAKKIKKGAVVWKLDKSCELLPLTKAVKKKFPKVFQLGDNYVLCRDNSEYMNHSCDPNTWWKGDTKFTARRDIKAGAEITYDYSTSDIHTDWVATWTCKCNAPDCRKRITSQDCLSESFQNKYGEHLPSWTKTFIEKSRSGGG